MFVNINLLDERKDIYYSRLRLNKIERKVVAGCTRAHIAQKTRGYRPYLLKRYKISFSLRFFSSSRKAATEKRGAGVACMGYR